MLIEAKTYRYCGHSKSDRCLYRTREEEATWRKKDPLILLASQLHQAGVAQAELDKINSEESELIEAAVRFAEQSEFPDPQTAMQKVNCDG
jgi:pyruvate dehydrogenase E1 component alpha subunit